MASPSQVETGRGVWENGAFPSGGNCERPTGYRSIFFSGSDLERVKGAITSSSQRLEGVMGQEGKCHLYLRYRPSHGAKRTWRGTPALYTQSASTSGPHGRGQRH